MSPERETCPVCRSWIFWIDGVCDAPKCEPFVAEQTLNITKERK